MRDLKLIREKKPLLTPDIISRKILAESRELDRSKVDIVWPQRAEWLRKPGARQNLWN